MAEPEEMPHGPDISINEEDLAPIVSIEEAELSPAQASGLFMPMLEVSLEDIAEIERQILRIGARDLPPVIHIRASDLPKIIQVALDELIPNQDLTNATTACYHGTSREVAERIRREGFRVGSGNASGSGIYFSVGGMTIAEGYVKGTPCIVRAKVDWGRVACFDDPSVKREFGSAFGGDAITQKGLSLGYHSILLSKKYSKTVPTIGVVLGKIGTYIKPPRIEVVELIDPCRRQG